jgi:signal transduction histidine kinase
LPRCSIYIGNLKLCAGRSDNRDVVASAPRTRDLRFGLVVSALAPVVLAVFCQAGYTLITQRAAVNRGLEDKALSLANMMVTVAGPSLLLEDSAGVADALAHVALDQDFGFVLALGIDGKPRGYRGPPGQRSIRVASSPPITHANLERDDPHGLLIASVPVLSQGDVIGAVYLGLKTGAVHKQVVAMALTAAAISLAGVAAAVAVILFLAAAISRRNRDLSRLLDTVDQAFLVMNVDGTLHPERSAKAREWFGEPRPEQKLWELLAPVNAEQADWLCVAWENVCSNVLPLEVSLDQMPRRLTGPARSFRLEYKVIVRGTEVEQLLVVITDVTAELRRERAEAAQHDFLSVIERLTRDRRGLFEFLEEGGRLVQRIANNSGNALSALHTLKGTSGMIGFATMAELCHELEERLHERGSELDNASRNRLVECWADFRDKLGFLTGRPAATSLEVDGQEYQRLLADLEARPELADLAAQMRSWQLEPIATRLGRLAEQARQLARRLGKGEIQIRIEHNRLRLPPEPWAAFWNAFSHVVRNAVDHGLEGPEVRASTGKPLVGTLWFRAAPFERGFVFELEDDGRGIDWSAVATRAAERGLPNDSEAALVDALFHAGLSTRHEVSDISGRGVGLAAVRAATVARGGRISVTTRPGRGTLFRFSFPEPVSSAPDTPAPVAEPLAGTA